MPNNFLILNGGKNQPTSHPTYVAATTKEVSQITNMLFSLRAGSVFESSAIIALLKK